MDTQTVLDEIVYSEILNKLGVCHGFSTKALGNMSYDRSQQGKASQNQEKFFSQLGIDLKNNALLMPPVKHSPIVALVQKLPDKAGRIILDNQSPEIIILDAENNQPGIDACLSYTPNTFLAILPADCAPIMFFEPITRFFGLIHAGSIGLAKGIIEKTFACLKKNCNIRPDQIYCYIGPCICQECYSHKINLRNLIADKLLKLGLPLDQLEISEFCTAHHDQLFFSHHRAKQTGCEQTEGRNMALIGLKQE